MSQDIRLALRLLARSPGFAAVAIAMLAIGVGSTTVVFSLVNGLYFRGPQFPDARRLVTVSPTSATRLCAGCGVGASWPAFADWRAEAGSFAQLEAYDESVVVVSAPLVPEQVRGARVTSGWFTLLRVNAAVGRTLAAADSEPGAPAAAVLAHRFWLRAFGGDEAAVGRSLRVDGTPVTIVGVLPPRQSLPEAAEIFLTMPMGVVSTNREDRRFGVVGRLNDDGSIDSAQRELAAIALRAARDFPAEEAEWSVDVGPLGSDRGGTEGSAFVVMLGAVGLMLAVACANLAALVLARSGRRRRELTVRSALGATRVRLLRQLLIESLVLGAIGGGVGLLLAAWAVPFAGRLLQSSEMPAYLEFVIDWRVVLAASVASVGSSLLMGLIPAFTATRLNLVDGLKAGGAAAPGSSRRDRRMRHALLVAQLALVLVLLSGAALVGRTFLNFVNRPKGYDVRGLMLAQVPLSGARYETDAALRAAVADIGARLAAQAGMQSALSANHFVRGFGREARPMQVDGADAPPGAAPSFAIAVTPGYFEALGVPMLAGRAFTPQDRSGTPDVAVVNRAMADALWPNGRALGGRVRLRPQRPDDPWRAVVGIVADVEGALRPGARINPLVYLPFDQAPGRPVDVTVRTADAVPVFASRVRAGLAEVDADQPLNNVRSGDEERRREHWYVGVFGAFYAVFGGFALLLAIVGVYGVASQTVSDRMREFGIRAALGADRRRLSSLVLGTSLRLAAVGAALGLAGAYLATRFLGFLLFGADPADPMVFGGVAFVLAAAVIVATAVPARRAARVDPATALKAD